jgi:PAS domain S-box-containing protein
MADATTGTFGAKRESPPTSLADLAFAAGICAFDNLGFGRSDVRYRTDAEDRLEWISPAGAKLLGYEAYDDLLGRPAAEVFYRQPGERAPLLATLACGDVPFCQEEMLRRADGTTVPVRTRAVRRKTATGADCGMEVRSLVLSEEIAARLTLAKALREMEILFDNALVGMLLARGRQIEKINARGAAILGYAAEELLGADVSLLFPDLPAFEAFRTAMERDMAASGVHVGEYGLSRKDGGVIVVRNDAKSISPSDRAEGILWTFEDVTEQKRLEEDLRASTLAAEAANVAKAQFLANMSHELRTPLNGILGMTQLLLDTAVDGETREYLGTIRQSASTLMHIVGDLLDLSNVEAGRLLVLEREFDPRVEFLPLLRNFATQSQFRAFDFSYHIDPLVPGRLIGDPDRTKQIFINLIGNAFKYTKKGSVNVRIGLWEAGSGETSLARPLSIRLHVAVADTGIGIEPKRQTAIFEPFGIGEEYLTKQYSGAGLGLAIAKRLANMMGGDITVTSEPGRGSTFYLTMEYGLPQAAAEKAPRKAVSEARPGPVASLRVLLAEDEPVNRIFTVRALQKLGHTVDTAVDGREALTLLGRAPYDLVLMDIQMPRLNGLDATRLIRSGQVPGISRSIPVVALTAYAMDSDRERGIEAGMDEYVTKPFEAAELIAAMDRALAK